MSTTLRSLECLGRHPAVLRVRDRTGPASGIGSPDYQALLVREIEALRKTARAPDAMRCLIATPD